MCFFADIAMHLKVAAKGSPIEYQLLCATPNDQTYLPGSPATSSYRAKSGVVRSQVQCLDWLSAVCFSQCRPLMCCDMVSLVAFDLILRIIFTGVVRVPFVVEILRMHLDDRAADVPGLRVPGDVVTDFKFSWYNGRLPFPIISYDSDCYVVFPAYGVTSVHLPGDRIVLPFFNCAADV